MRNVRVIGVMTYPSSAVGPNPQSVLALTDRFDVEIRWWNERWYNGSWNNSGTGSPGCNMDFNAIE